LRAHLDRNLLDVKRFDCYCLAIEIFEAERDRTAGTEGSRHAAY